MLEECLHAIFLVGLPVEVLFLFVELSVTRLFVIGRSPVDIFFFFRKWFESALKVALPPPLCLFLLQLVEVGRLQLELLQLVFVTE